MTRASRPLSRYNDMLNVFRHASRQGVEIKMESGDLVQKKKKKIVRPVQRWEWSHRPAPL
jgi:hypothetical protein